MSSRHASTRCLGPGSSGSRRPPIWRGMSVTQIDLRFSTGSMTAGPTAWLARSLDPRESPSASHPPVRLRIVAEERGIAISLFSGAGGLDLGVEAAGYRVAAAVEHDHDAADTMEKNFSHLASPV